VSGFMHTDGEEKHDDLKKNVYVLQIHARKGMVTRGAREPRTWQMGHVSARIDAGRKDAI
jgi:hypothetical protein